MDSSALLSLLRARGAMLLVPDLVEAIAGEKIKGSWWSHAHGGEIFRLTSELDESPEVVVTKIGKVTFIHARLFAPLARVVSDPAWRKPRIAKLDAAGKKLLVRVEKEGRVREGHKALEASTLVRVVQEQRGAGSARAPHRHRHRRGVAPGRGVHSGALLPRAARSDHPRTRIGACPAA